MSEQKLPYCQHHIVQLLSTYEKQSYPLDLFVRNYFRLNPALGAKDRKTIAEAAYTLIRWRSLVNAICPSGADWEYRVKFYQTFIPEEYLARTDLPLFVRYACPEGLFRLLVSQYGENEAKRLSLVANTSAPTTLRVNLLHTSREALLHRLGPQYGARACLQSPWGIVFPERVNLLSLPEFAAGEFEMQDEASQLVANLMDPKPGQQVLDFCSGSGGKTLAFAHKMEQKGQIFLHDIRPKILAEARKRLRRAGVQNAQVIQPDAPHLNKLKKRMDWVLVDAPCSGTGTLRRNPDMKWTFDENRLYTLVAQQRVIFERALSYLNLEGTIVYATCSLLCQENQEQVEHFIRVYDLEVKGSPFISLPEEGGMDGFFAVQLQRKSR